MTAIKFKAIATGNNMPPHKVSYNPCRTAGTANAKKHNDILYLGYSFANDVKYPAIPHHIA